MTIASNPTGTDLFWWLGGGGVPYSTFTAVAPAVFDPNGARPVSIS